MKVLIVGIGKIGGDIASKLISHGVSELYLYGREYEKTIGISCDLQETSIYCRVKPLKKLEQLPQVDYTFFAFSTLKWRKSIGVNDRMIEARQNISIIQTIAKEVDWCNLGTIIIVSNPIDILTRYCCEHFNTRNVFGFGNSLDELRVLNTINQSTFETKSNRLVCVGEHGRSIVPVLSQIIDSNKLQVAVYEELLQTTFLRTQKIISNYSIPFYAPMLAMESLIALIISKQSGSITLSAWLDTPFCGIKDIAIGVPVKFTYGVPENANPVGLSTYEQELFIKSAQILKSQYTSIV